jgi:hypothetical protein
MAGCLAESRGCWLPPGSSDAVALGGDARRGGSAMQGQVLFNCFFCGYACGVSSVMV